MKRIVALSCCIIAAGFLYTRPAFAIVQVGASGMFGFGGEADYEIEYENHGHSDFERDLDPTVGFNLYGEVPVAFGNRLIFGGEFRCLWIDPEHQSDHDVCIDICPYIKVSFEVASRFYLYGRFAPGFSIYAPDNHNYDTGFGFNIGFFGGPEFRITENFGVYSEIGFIYHKVYGDVDYDDGALRHDDSDYEIDFAQFQINVGLFARF